MILLLQIRGASWMHVYRSPSQDSRGSLLGYHLLCGSMFSLFVRLQTLVG